MVEAYERLHYADTERLKGLGGLPTRFRSNVILRFGDDWENKIFDFADTIKPITEPMYNVAKKVESYIPAFSEMKSTGTVSKFKEI